MNRRHFLKLSASGAIGGILGSYSLFFDRYMVQVNRYRIVVPRLPQEFHRFSIVQLTDLHYGFLDPLSFLQGVIKMANKLRNDITVCTGDYVIRKGTNEEINRIWPVLTELQAPLGVYSVLGNHDHAADNNRSVYWLDRSGQNIRHRVKYFEREGKRLWLAGGGDLWRDHRNLDDLLRNIPEEDCRIVLAHNPDSADTAFSERIDLMISGHTHGGQVILPFTGPVVLPVMNKNYTAGLKTSSKGLPVFISKGIGCSAMFPVRFNCAPEIAVLELCCC
jgi:uncharacterized protein